MELTEEQEKILKEMSEERETSTLFICTKCNEKLTGMKEVREHHTNKQHYGYNTPGVMGTLHIL